MASPPGRGRYTGVEARSSGGPLEVRCESHRADQPPAVQSVTRRGAKPRRSDHRPSRLRIPDDHLLWFLSGRRQALRRPRGRRGERAGSLGLPAEFLAAGLLHNIYGNGDFGDGRAFVVTAYRRRLVREAVGDRVESLSRACAEFRISSDNIGTFDERLGSLGEVDRTLVLIDLADWLEKYVDLGVHYFGDSDWVSRPVADHGAKLIDFARRLGRTQPMLATMLAEAFALAAEADVPEALRAPDGRPYLKLVLPRSCRLRFRILVEERRQRTGRALRAVRRRMGRAWWDLRARSARAPSCARPGTR